LTAVRLVAPQTVRLVDGTTLSATTGDWLIATGQTLLDVVRAAAFPGPYEVVVDQQRVLSPDDRHQIEAVAGIGSTDSPAALLAAIRRLASIAIGGVDLPFTPGQLEELKHRAEKRGRTVAQEIEAVVARIHDELFWHS
jgi:hypothetical protein